MYRFRILLMLLITFFSFYSVHVSAEEHTSRPATKEEIVGFWQLVPLPDSLKPKIPGADPWPATCQWFGFYSDGTLRTIGKLRSPCEDLTANKLSETMTISPAVVSWEHHEPALVLVKRSDVKDYMETWEATVVLQAFSRGGAEFRPGDIIMYFRNLKEKKTLYIRHLRRLVSE